MPACYDCGYRSRALCADCGCCDECCECSEALFDADELGLNPEEDDKRQYRFGE